MGEEEMRKLLVTLLAAVMLFTTTGIAEATHGPGPETDTNPPGWEPVYPTPIPVIDTIALAIRSDWQRDIYRDARDQALAMYGEAGLRFEVSERRLKWFAPYKVFDDTIPPAFYVVSGVIRLVQITVDGTSGSGFGTWQQLYDSGVEVPGGGAVFLQSQSWWYEGYNFTALRSHVAHEVGHALGMWHKEGGVMGGGTHLDTHELESLRVYYELQV